MPIESKSEINWKEVCKRVEKAIVILTTKYIRDGFELDRLSASQALVYAQSKAAGGPDNEKREGEFFDFAGRHGICLNWLMLGDITGLICSAAAGSRQLHHAA